MRKTRRVTGRRDARAENQESDWPTRCTWRGDKVPLFLAYTCIITYLFISVEPDTINYFHISPLDAFSLFLHITVFVTVCTAQLVS